MAASRDWIAGFCVALAESHRRLLGGNDSAGVCEVMRNAGITLSLASESGVDEYDLNELRRAGVPSIPQSEDDDNKETKRGT
jgi:hypothetical protein